MFAGGTPLSLSGATGADNNTDSEAGAVAYVNNPLAAIPALNLFPKPGALKKVPADLTGMDAFPEWNLDFNGSAYDATFRGGYSGEGANPGWKPALSPKP